MPIVAEPWQQQRERVGRWLERLREMYRGTVCEHRDSKHLEDDARAFFVECYHLGDYLWKAEPPICTEGEVKACRKGHPALEVCRDLALGFKHLKDAAAKFGPKTFLLEINDSPESTTTRHGLRLSILPNGGDALAVAEEAVIAWDELISAHERGSNAPRDRRFVEETPDGIRITPLPPSSPTEAG